MAYFAASVDDPETNKKFAESLDANYPILSDPDQKVASAYGVLNESRGVARRWTFYIDKNGIIQNIDREVNAHTHGEDMVKKLQELGFPRSD